MTEAEFFDILDERYHFTLLHSKTRSKIESFLDTSLIPDEYKAERHYYERYSNKYKYPNQLPVNHLLEKDQHSSKIFSQNLIICFVF